MDLRETRPTPVNRHPWELARVKALRTVAQTYGVLSPGMRVLDLGCGDGFLIETLCPKSTAAIDAVDIHLSAEQLAAFAHERPRLQFHNSDQSLADSPYDLITMFDVLEHIEDDVAFLRETMARFASPGTHFFLTVPAFQALFSAHDTFLQHHRRYSRRGFEQVLGRAGLRIVSSGYLFGLLLPVRGLAVLREKVLARPDAEPGIGHWRHGRFLTLIIKALLDADNLLLVWLGRMGIRLPGLTVWAICETPR